MGDIDVGGDGSVKWKVNADRARLGSVHSNPDPHPGKPNRHHQRGIDETAAGQYFTFSIEVPAGLVDRNNLVSALHSAADTVAVAVPGSGARVSFNLLIEEQNENQIQITWNSDLGLPLVRAAAQVGAVARAGVSRGVRKSRK